MTETCYTAPSRECVEWARRVNSRWLVHEGLNETARMYLDHLADTDPRRLEKSCWIARALVRQNRDTEDPKPRFYGGLFCLATPEEAQRFFSDRLFIAALWPGLELSSAHVEKLSEETVRKLAALREEIVRVKTQIQS